MSIKVIGGIMDGKNGENEEVEDTTKYGEFISSYFGWTTLSKQKKRAEELENIEKKDKTRKK